MRSNMERMMSIMRDQFIWWGNAEKTMNEGYLNIGLVPILRTAGRNVISLV